MATSGTVGSTVFLTQQVIDHAFRRCDLTPQQITSEHIDTANDLLWLFLSTLNSRGIKLWNIDRIILPLYPEEMSVPTPIGTEMVMDLNLRTSERITGTATATEGDAENAFDGDTSTACTQVSMLGTITMTLDSATAVPQYGVLPNVSGTWDFVIEFSDDDITYVPIITRTAQAVVAGEWLWFDVEGITTHSFYRLRAEGTTVLDVAELVYQNLPQEIPLYQLNRTDYSNLPNKTMTGRPTQYWYDRQRTQPIITLWPNVEAQFTFANLTAYVQRQVQDVGEMTEEIEVPDRWYLAVVTNLAKHCSREIKEVDRGLIPQIDADAGEELSKAWDGETDSSDTFLRPNISPYTR